MSKQILLLISVSLGLGLSIITPSTVSPELARAISWFIAGILSSTNKKN